MAYKQLVLTDIVSAIQQKIVKKTGLKCYDYVEKNAKSPFYFLEVASQTSASNKTMYVNTVSVMIHCIAEAKNSSVGIYKLINNVQEALTEDIEISTPYKLVLQTEGSLQTIKTDETGEKHAIIAYDFLICYDHIEK